MADALNVLASEATHDQWRAVFRAEDGWVLWIYFRDEDITNTRYGHLSKRLRLRSPNEHLRVFILPAKAKVEVGETIGNQITFPIQPSHTLGDLLRIANELAATEFCGGWAEVER